MIVGIGNIGFFFSYDGWNQLIILLEDDIYKIVIIG